MNPGGAWVLPAVYGCGCTEPCAPCRQWGRLHGELGEPGSATLNDGAARPAPPMGPPGRIRAGGDSAPGRTPAAGLQRSPKTGPIPGRGGTQWPAPGVAPGASGQTRGAVSRTSALRSALTTGRKPAWMLTFRTSALSAPANAGEPASQGFWVLLQPPHHGCADASSRASVSGRGLLDESLDSRPVKCRTCGGRLICPGPSKGLMRTGDSEPGRGLLHAPSSGGCVVSERLPEPTPKGSRGGA